MKDFGFIIPQNCQFGLGALKKLPDFLKICGSDNVMLISDRGLEAIGVVDKVREIIKAAGLKYSEYLDVIPNPTVDIVNECAAQYKAAGATAILALGGGSPMDVAKAVGVVAKFGGSITDYEGVGKVPGNIDPLIAIPTTAGTGSEVTVAAVITDEARNYKLSVLGPPISPTYAVLDPELIMSAPASVAASCGVDALIHAMESYINTDCNPFSAAMAEKAMELIGGNIRKFVARRDDVDAACAMMLGSTFAGIAFANNRLGDIHAMSHPVSAFYHVAHGVANAVLMPTIFEYNALAADERYAKIYEYITGKKAGADFVPQMTCDALRQLNADLGIPACLADVGVEEEKIPQMAIDAMKSGNVTVNPRITTVKDVEALYRKALYK
jgi:alcohol dehydrogenase